MSVLFAGILILLLLGFSYIYLQEALTLYGVWSDTKIDAKRAEGFLIAGLTFFLAGTASAYTIYMAIKPALKKK